MIISDSSVSVGGYVAIKLTCARSRSSRMMFSEPLIVLPLGVRGGLCANASVLYRSDRCLRRTLEVNRGVGVGLAFAFGCGVHDLSGSCRLCVQQPVRAFVLLAPLLRRGVGVGLAFAFGCGVHDLSGSCRLCVQQPVRAFVLLAPSLRVHVYGGRRTLLK